MYQTPLEIHFHEVWTVLSGVLIFQDITNLYISDSFSCVLGQSFVKLAMQVSFSMLVVASCL